MAFKLFNQITNKELPSMEVDGVNAYLKDFSVSEDSDKPITSGLFRLKAGESLENQIITYIEENYKFIENDMNKRNSTARHKTRDNKTRKKRQELSISAAKSIKKEKVEIIVKFN